MIPTPPLRPPDRLFAEAHTTRKQSTRLGFPLLPETAQDLLYHEQKKVNDDHRQTTPTEIFTTVLCGQVASAVTAHHVYSSETNT